MYSKPWIPAKDIIRMFDVIIKLILIYGCQIWGGANSVCKLERVRGKFYKQVLGLSIAAANYRFNAKS